VRTLHVLAHSAPVYSPALRTSHPLASTDAATTTTATEGAPVPVPVTRPARQNSLSAETLQTLEKRLAQRPDRQELQDRNILKGVHPVLFSVYVSFSLSYYAMFVPDNDTVVG
jgi:RPEL repeat